jgi:hypothetical protein
MFVIYVTIEINVASGAAEILFGRLLTRKDLR